ncbi:hypothetical protein AVEN_217990-1 [Araneus ventricosus]|uniref:Uncharacterized protein n=1 Tax=Araneus ventricosus TaxID=182803 RepID=A0A4Y2VSB5_ARAVE|nr:hypothetical protein AVEN_217990-1 [Araneus ventricosus]
MTRTTLELAPSPNFRIAISRKVILPLCFISRAPARVHRDLRWNRFRAWSPPPEAEALPLGHRCPFIYVDLRCRVIVFIWTQTYSFSYNNIVLEIMLSLTQLVSQPFSMKWVKWCTLDPCPVCTLGMATKHGLPLCCGKCDATWKLPHPVLTGGSERQRQK